MTLRSLPYLEEVDGLTADQAAQLTELYQAEWWTAGRTRRDVARMLDGSDIVLGLVEPDTRELAAFARVLTDGVFKAIIFDVIVRADCRARGVGDQLVRRILAHPRLRGVRHTELYCLPELVPFYRRFDFSTDVGSVALMRCDRAAGLSMNLAGAAIDTA